MWFSRLKFVLKIVSCYAIFVLLPRFAFADCPSDELQSVERPVEQGAKTTFTYKFRIKCVNPNWPTVIVIPGGPGLTSTDSEEVVPHANMIYTDPRGTGVNSSFWQHKPTDKVITTEDIADDIVALIKAKGLKNYMLFGTSFGTAVGTIVASKSEKDSTLTPPKALVLQGTIGKALRVGEQNEATQKLWSQSKTEAEYCITCQADRLLQKFTQKQVGGLIEALIGEGSEGKYLNHFLNKATDAEIQPVMQKLENMMDSNQLRLYRDVGCHEFSPEGITDAEYVNGELVTVSQETCVGKSLDRPFDSKKWPVQKSKIIYFAGTHDISTPFAQTAYHYENQQQKNKLLVCVEKAGHNPLTLNLEDCSGPIWQQIFAGQNDFSQASAACGRASIQTLQQCGEKSLK